METFPSRRRKTFELESSSAALCSSTTGTTCPMGFGQGALVAVAIHCLRLWDTAGLRAEGFGMLLAAEWSCADCCFTSRCHRALQLPATVWNCCLSMLAGDKKLQPVPNARKENCFYMPVQRQAHATYMVP